MIPMKVVSCTTLRMVTVQDAAGDVVAMAEVVAADMVMGIVVDMATVAMLVGEPTPLVTQTLPSATPTHRLKVTQMMMPSFYMIT